MDSEDEIGELELKSEFGLKSVVELAELELEVAELEVES